jgi:hypothetical protein
VLSGTAGIRKIAPSALSHAGAFSVISGTADWEEPTHSANGFKAVTARSGHCAADGGLEHSVFCSDSHAAAAAYLLQLVKVKFLFGCVADVHAVVCHNYSSLKCFSVLFGSFVVPFR